jgi:hypothetical protein
VFHKGVIEIGALKAWLARIGVEART